MKLIHFLGFSALTFVSVVTGFPTYGSLAGLTIEERDLIISRLQVRQAEPAPGPSNDTSAKLVNDEDHPWKPLQPGDIRGPCPGLNTLASHGWLPRNGIATPAQIVDAVQQGFNMGNGLALTLTYAAMLVDGNMITNLLSIGSKSSKTGPDPPKPAIVGGLDTHAVFEGDASMTRGDAFFGDNHSFNETLFEELTDFSNRFGAGNYNITVAGEFRFQRIQDSIATNPEFSFVAPRFIAAYGETVFPVLFFIDGRVSDGQLNLTVARGFFQNSSMPDGFFRANRSIGISEAGDLVEAVFSAHPIQPGKNQGGVNNYVFDPTSTNLTSSGCLAYRNFVTQIVQPLYPNPTGDLRDALNINLDNFFIPLKDTDCQQIFPFGQ